MYANTDVYNHPLFRSFKNTQDKEPSSNTDEVIKIIVASNLHHQDSSEVGCSHVLTVMTMIVFFVHVVTIVRNAQTTVASSFGLHFRCV